MGDVVSYGREGAIAVLTIDNPPVNALNVIVRRCLAEGIARANADEGAEAIVIAGAGRTFPAGADIREFGKPPQTPSLPEVCQAIEDSAKPVVAALHGTALGGGFEVALAAHARVAAPDARVGLPEITLGILPGAGGTQRLPRLIGAEPSLAIMLSGRPVRADRAQALGVVDVVANGDLLEEAIDEVTAIAEGRRSFRRSSEATRGFSDPMAYQDQIQAARITAKANPVPAAAKIVDCVEAAQLLPFEAGLAFERAAFEEALRSPQANALRYMFLAERRAAKPGTPKGTALRHLTRALVIGAGTMGTGIATALLDAGLQVTLTDRTANDAEIGRDRITGSYDRAVSRQKLGNKTRDERLGRLNLGVGLDGVKTADLVIEAVVEDMEVKKAVLAEVGAGAKRGAVFASNTSYLDINALADATGRPADVLGLHFFSPAHRMRLLEVVVTDRTADDVVATGFALAKRMGKQPVRTGVANGFIGNAVLAAYQHAADLTLLDGASPYDIDDAMRAYGFPLGPYEGLDLVGLDISWTRRKRLAGTRDPALRYLALGDRLCEAGRFGQKTGRGYYRYSEGSRTGRRDDQVLMWLNEERARHGTTARNVSRDEIQERCVAAMMNAGARLVADRVAIRPSDVDVVMVHGYSFPRWRGGPMKAAQIDGVLHLYNRLRALAKKDAFWLPHPLVLEATKTAAGFEGVV